MVVRYSLYPSLSVKIGRPRFMWEMSSKAPPGLSIPSSPSLKFGININPMQAEIGEHWGLVYEWNFLGNEPICTWQLT